MMMTVMKEEEEFIVILRIKAEDSLPPDGWDGMLALGYVCSYLRQGATSMHS